MEKLEYYSDLVNEVFKDNSVQAQILSYEEIDRMLMCDYQNPKALQRLEWIGDRKLVSTGPADASNAATRSFAARMPIVSVQPLSEEPLEYDRCERIETALEWELSAMNARGKKPVHWQIVESAMRYCKVALQTEYLPYSLKARKKDNYIKAVLRGAKFNWRVHHPKTVFAQEGPYGQYEFVVKRSKYSMNWLVSKYGKENMGIKKMLESLAKSGSAKLAEQLAQDVYYFDVYTWDTRVQWASMDESGHEWEFLREEHKLPFIPWVIVDNEDPILKSVVDADLWKNSNAIRTIVFSKAVDMAAHPDLWIQTMSGDLEGVQQDNTNPSQPIVTDSQAKVTQLRPPQIDPQLSAVQQMTESELFRTSVAQVLASIEDIGKTSTFSTVNAMLQAALTQLSLAQNAAERAEKLAFTQSLQWIDYSNIPLIMYRPRSKGTAEKRLARGGEIAVMGAGTPIPEKLKDVVSQFDPEFLYIDVKLQSKSITDKQAEITNQINVVERLGGSRELAFEALGLGDYALSEARRAQEDIDEAEKQAEIKRIVMQPDLEAQAQQMQMQAGMQQQQQAQQQQFQMAQQQEQMNAEQQKAAAENARRQQMGNAYSGSQGFDTRSGGNPPAGGAPGMGREQMNGQSASGQGLA